MIEKDGETFEVTRPLKRCPSHPGEVLDDILLDIGRPKTEIAAMLGISRQQLHDILAGRKPVSPNVAARLGRMFGGGAALWLNLQASHDAWLADRDVRLDTIPRLVTA